LLQAEASSYDSHGVGMGMRNNFLHSAHHHRNFYLVKIICQRNARQLFISLSGIGKDQSYL
jgi:hypothetical protein